MITKLQITEARERIAAHVHRTPVLTSQNLNALAGCEIFFKCENFQKVGAFKFRGACNAVFSLTNNEAADGVATHSSGNHAQGLALAAQKRGIKAYIVMPENSPAVKIAAVKSYGGAITFCENTLLSRESTLAEVVKKTGAHFIHPFDDDRIIAGQATAALELFDEIKNLDIIVAPVGGGGLLSGTSLAAHFFSPQTEIYGAEPKNVDDAFQSLKAGHIVPNAKTQTIADGLKTNVCERTFAIIQKHVRKILTTEEENIVPAMKLIWERLKVVAEPSASVPLATILEHKREFAGKRVGVIISGGNVDFPR